MRACSQLLFCRCLPITTADAQWLNQPTPNIPRTADGKPDLAAPPPRGADGHPDLSGLWVRQGGQLQIPVPDRALTQRSRDVIREREETYFKDHPCVPVPAHRARSHPRVEAGHPDALSHRIRLRDTEVSPHLHGRAPPRGRSRADMDGLFRRPMGRGHAGGRQLRVQRSDVARSRVACPIRRRSAPPNDTAGERSDNCRSSSP